MTARHVLFLLSSARRGGNSETLARSCAAALDPLVRQTWVDLTTPPLPPFTDSRPAPAPAPTGPLAQIATAILDASDIVLVAPVYWYALPAPAKLLLDHWSGWLDAPGMDFVARLRGRRLWLITTRADPDPTVPEPVEAMLRRSADWLGLGWGGALHGVADAPGDILQDRPTMARAGGFLAPATGAPHHP